MRSPLAYARRILINLATDAAPRRRRRRIELEPATATNDPIVDPLAGYDDRAELLGALAALPARQRAVLVLRYFNDLTERQAAEVLGCPRGTVKSSAARGLATLREALQQTMSTTGGACHD
jgi:RNA polymerase sigma factor (sigma-70 family)